MFYDTFKNDLRAFDDASFSTQNKRSSFNSFYRDYSYGAGFDLGGNLTEKNSLKFSTIVKYDVHREHDNHDPVTVDKDRTYSFGLENTYRFTEQTKLITHLTTKLSSRIASIKMMNLRLVLRRKPALPL